MAASSAILAVVRSVVGGLSIGLSEPAAKKETCAVRVWMCVCLGGKAGTMHGTRKACSTHTERGRECLETGLWEFCFSHKSTFPPQRNFAEE